MLEQFKDLAPHPYVVSSISLFIAFYLLRDTVRAIVYIFTRALGFKKQAKSKDRTQ